MNIEAMEQTKTLYYVASHGLFFKPLGSHTGSWYTDFEFAESEAGIELDLVSIPNVA